MVLDLRFPDPVGRPCGELIGHRVGSTGVDCPPVGMHQVAHHQWLIAAGYQRLVHSRRRAHPAVFANVPMNGSPRAAIAGMIEIRDAFGHQPRRGRVAAGRRIRGGNRTTVIHPPRRPAEDRRLADRPFAVGQLASAKVRGNRLRDPDRQKAEIGFAVTLQPSEVDLGKNGESDYDHSICDLAWMRWKQQHTRYRLARS